MKTIVAGSRDFNNKEQLFNALTFHGLNITEVVSGKAKGADALGEEWAKENIIPIRSFPADWTAHGKAAGPIRNGQMARYADALIAFWDGKSRGTQNMIEQAKRHDLKVIVYLTTGEVLQSEV